MEGVPSSKDYNGGFASKLMVSNRVLSQLSNVLVYLDDRNVYNKSYYSGMQRFDLEKHVVS
jgi:hypothetical protein